MTHYQTPPAVEAHKPWRSGNAKIRAAQIKAHATVPFENEAFEALLKTLDEVWLRAKRAQAQELAEYRWARLGA